MERVVFNRDKAFYRACALALLLAAGCSWAAATGEQPLSARPAAAVPDGISPQAQQLKDWVETSGDAAGQPFAIVDKPAAQLLVFDPAGQLIGAAPALLGLAPGEHSLPGVGRLAGGHIPPQARTTPAGRYLAEPGRNLQGEAIVWVDYGAALAIHRLRPAPAAERRAQRLAWATPSDNRISLGCIVVDPLFYDQVVAPSLGRHAGKVYVLPDKGDWRAHWSRPSPVLSGL